MVDANANMDGRIQEVLVYKYADLINIGMVIFAYAMKELLEYQELADHAQLDLYQIVIKQIVFVKTEIKFLCLLKVPVLTALKIHIQIHQVLNVIVSQVTHFQEINVYQNALANYIQMIREIVSAPVEKFLTQAVVLLLLYALEDLHLMQQVQTVSAITEA